LRHLSLSVRVSALNFDQNNNAAKEHSMSTEQIPQQEQELEQESVAVERDAPSEAERSAALDAEINDRVRRLLIRDQRKSDRDIAREAKTSDLTVARVREGLEREHRQLERGRDDDYGLGF
jgi:hypothetical protein